MSRQLPLAAGLAALLAVQAAPCVSAASSSAGQKRPGASPAPAKPPARKAAPKRARTPVKAVAPKPVAIERPDTLEPFFARLASLPPAGTEDSGRDVVRILHFGDSHVAADYWTGELRRRLQAGFGDAGPGYVMPGRPWRYFRHALVRSPAASGWETAGLGPDPRDGLYGLSGVGLVPAPGGEPATVEGSFRWFEVQLLALAAKSCVSVAVDGTTVFAGTLDGSADCEAGAGACCFLDVAEVPGEPLRLAWVSNGQPLPEGPHRLEVRDACGGAVRVLGADLTTGLSGVIVDTLGVNGAEITALRKWRETLLPELLAHGMPALAVVSYGTNEMGRKEFAFEEYRAECVEALAGLRRAAPGLPVLVTGPIDRGVRGRKAARRLVEQNEGLVVRALREAAAETGCAFWDAKAAIGGDGAIARWASAGLAQRDLVHLTGSGYAKLAALLHDGLLEEYERYRRRRAGAP